MGVRWTVVGVAILFALTGAGLAAGAGTSQRGAAEAWTFACSSSPFSLDVFDGPANAEDGDDAAAEAFRKLLDEYPFQDRAPDHWRVLTSAPDYVEYGAGKPKRNGFDYVALALDDDEEWRLAAYGGCTPSTFVGDGDLNTADWKLDESKPVPTKSDTRVRALLTERACASGRPSDKRIRPPRVFYGAKRVVILALVKARPGNTQTCPGNPAAEYTFRLDEPIGDRVLLDGAEYPFRARYPRPAR